MIKKITLTLDTASYCILWDAVSRLASRYKDYASSSSEECSKQEFLKMAAHCERMRNELQEAYEGGENI